MKKLPCGKEPNIREETSATHLTEQVVPNSHRDEEDEVPRLKSAADAIALKAEGIGRHAGSAVVAEGGATAGSEAIPSQSPQLLRIQKLIWQRYLRQSTFINFSQRQRA